MTTEEFEKLVEEGFAKIPERLREKVKNVAIFVEDVPSLETRKKQNLSRYQTLFGLYEGIPNTRRAHYGVGMTLPDRITIFRQPIESAAEGDPEHIREIVRDTIWHEIAHHFGMDEPAVRASEKKRRLRQ
ncbi:MAG: metallopeptidase family protein [Candidatus Andersenbacteria bacterium]|nr:metallopeptidase family protein [Candidatus Andersenbacteria bacterium]MBI3250911.1 metallopeptidase family protein [Candidatus Andersenbacteria bacterium]